jgi:hypothetical protein
MDEESSCYGVRGAFAAVTLLPPRDLPLITVVLEKSVSFAIFPCGRQWRYLVSIFSTFACRQAECQSGGDDSLSSRRSSGISTLPAIAAYIFLCRARDGITFHLCTLVAQDHTPEHH